MADAPQKSELLKRLRSTVARPHKYEQGETVFGVTEFNNDPPGSGWASGGQLFGTNDRRQSSARQRAEEYFYQPQPLRSPDMHDTVLYRATVAVSGSSTGRDTVVVDPSEESELILTDIQILARRKPGEHPDS